MSASITITLPVGRIVSGHPMKFNPKTDRKTKQPKLNKTGEQIKEAYFAVAIPKGPEQHWSQTEWGAQIYKVGQDGWPRGEWQIGSFAWKITDGDSNIPNLNMVTPASREGYPGHWVIGFSSQFQFQCFHPAQNGIYPQMQNENEIKCGDYVMVNADFKDNAPSESPGIYANPRMVLLVQSGVAIVGGEGNPNDAFGGVVPQLPANAQVAPASYVAPAPQAAAFTQPTPAAYAPPQVAPVVQPAPDFLNPQRMVNYQGQVVKVSDLLAAGWNEALIAQHTTPVA